MYLYISVAQSGNNQSDSSFDMTNSISSTFLIVRATRCCNTLLQHTTWVM